MDVTRGGDVVVSELYCAFDDNYEDLMGYDSFDGDGSFDSYDDGGDHFEPGGAWVGREPVNLA